MSTHPDRGRAGGTEAAEVKTYTQEEVDALLAAAAPAINTEPAFEEGPHLADPDIRAAKRRQLRDAGIDPLDARLTDEMRAILRD